MWGQSSLSLNNSNSNSVLWSLFGTKVAKLNFLKKINRNNNQHPSQHLYWRYPKLDVMYFSTQTRHLDTPEWSSSATSFRRLSLETMHKIYVQTSSTSVVNITLLGHEYFHENQTSASRTPPPGNWHPWNKSSVTQRDTTPDQPVIIPFRPWSAPPWKLLQFNLSSIIDLEKAKPRRDLRELSV